MVHRGYNGLIYSTLSTVTKRTLYKFNAYSLQISIILPSQLNTFLCLPLDRIQTGTGKTSTHKGPMETIHKYYSLKCR